MNSKQVWKYAGMWTEKDMRFFIVFRCTFCPYEVQLQKRGNALGRAQRHFGHMATHIREKHPEKLTEGKNAVAK